MTVARPSPAGVFVLALTWLGATSTAQAVDRELAGAWIQDASLCEEVFTRTGGSVAFKKPVNMFAPAFIISGSRIRTPNASCQIKGAKRSGERRVLALACATSVSVDDVPASLELVADGTLRRYLNDRDKVGSKYERCALPTGR